MAIGIPQQKDNIWGKAKDGPMHPSSCLEPNSAQAPKLQLRFPVSGMGTDKAWLGPRMRRPLQKVSGAVDWFPFCH